MFGVDEFVFGAPQAEKVGCGQQEQYGHAAQGAAQLPVGLLVGERQRQREEQQEQYDPPFYRAEGIEYGHRGRPKRHQPHQQDARRQAPLQEFVAVVEVARGDCARQLPGAIAAGNLDYCNKLLQWCLPPRILLMGLVPLWTAAMTVFDPLGSIKWWIVLLLLLFALALALPDEQTDRQLGRALRRMPVLFLLTAANLFRLRGTKDKFIHTEHTGAGGNAPGANTPTEP